MKTTGLLSLVLLLFLGACVPAPLRPDRISTPPLHFTVPKIEHVTLANGIRLYLKEDHELPLVDVTVMAPGGTISEPAGKVGLSTLLAKSLRTAGTGSRSAAAIDLELERLAADFSVSADSYALTLNLSLLAGNLDTGLDLLREVLRTPAFAPDRVELARKEMMEAIRRQNDHPQALAGRTLLQAIYGDHPLGRSPTERTVQAITRDDLQAAYEETFSPEQLWIAVSGDFNREKLIADLEARFASWPPQKIRPRLLPPLKAPGEGVLIIGQKDLPQSVIMLGEIGINKDAPDLAAVRVMNFILGGGSFNSRLMKEVREERGLAYSVYSAFQVGRLLPGPFIAQCETKSSSTLEALQLIRAAMTTIRSQAVRPEELQVAKESLNNSFVFSFTDPHEVVTQALRLDFYGYPPEYLETYRDKVEALTVADILQAARDHLHPEKMAIVLIGNEEAFAAPLTTLNLPLQRLPLPEPGQ